MIIPIHNINKFGVAAGALLLLSACSMGPTKPDGLDDVRSKLTRLQSDPQLASRAPVAIKDAEDAVRAAEQSQEDEELAKHLVIIADRKVDIAQARAQSRLFEDQRKEVGEQRQTARLDARTREADSARADANAAKQQSEEQKRQFERQLAELNAKETDRGMVVTLGDVLFDTGKSTLKGGATSNLNKLAAFLNKYPDRSVIIEGHTDSVGSEDSNFTLSEHRANSVKAYLIKQGVDFDRLSASGMGEDSPVADNGSAAGRQQNRRVEVIISNADSSPR